MRIVTGPGANIEIADHEIDDLAAGLRGQLVRAGNDGYEEARVVFNGIFDRRPALIVRCRGVGDVIDAVRFARRHDLLVAVRGGGHSVAGKSICDGGIMIDLSPMRSVRVDARARTAWVEGGAIWADVDRETQAFGLAAPGGVVSHTGVAGLTLNGGIGWLRNKHGLSCDNLLSAELVTADGEVIRASSTEHAELLWALRGGGGNFGVVTGFEFRLHPVGPTVAALFPIYPLAEAAGVLRRWRQWLVDAPAEATSEAVLWTIPAADSLPAAAHGHAVVIPGGVYAGSPVDGERVLAPLREFGRPLAEISGALPYRGVQQAFDPFFPNTGEIRSYWKSLHAAALDDELIDVVVELARGRPNPECMLTIEHIGAAVRDVASDATAFAMRDAAYIIGLMGTWREPRDDDARIGWVRDAWDRLAPHSTGAVYLNFLGDDAGETLLRTAFGTNFARLVAVKDRYDPHNLFRSNQNIRPSVG